MCVVKTDPGNRLAQLAEHAVRSGDVQLANSDELS